MKYIEVESIQEMCGNGSMRRLECVEAEAYEN